MTKKCLQKWRATNVSKKFRNGNTKTNIFDSMMNDEQRGLFDQTCLCFFCRYFAKFEFVELNVSLKIYWVGKGSCTFVHRCCRWYDNRPGGSLQHLHLRDNNALCWRRSQGQDHLCRIHQPVLCAAWRRKRLVQWPCPILPSDLLTLKRSIFLLQG